MRNRVCTSVCDFFLTFCKVAGYSNRGVVWCVVKKGAENMPKLIQSYEAVECKSIRRISDTPYEIWNWREECVGLRGILFIFESEKKHPGKHFIRFMNVEYTLTTGCGEVTFEDNTITLTTRNSVYEFEIFGGDKKCKENY